MANRYFIVPMTASSIKMDDTSLFKILRVVDEKLAKREETRKDIQYASVEPEYIYSMEVETFLKKYNDKTSKMFKEKGLPEKLILIDDGDTLTELGTRTPVSINNGEKFLKQFEVSGEDVVSYFVLNKDYQEEVARLIGAFYEKSRVLAKKI